MKVDKKYLERLNQKRGRHYPYMTEGMKETLSKGWKRHPFTGMETTTSSEARAKEWRDFYKANFHYAKIVAEAGRFSVWFKRKGVPLDDGFQKKMAKYVLARMDSQLNVWNDTIVVKTDRLFYFHFPESKTWMGLKITEKEEKFVQEWDGVLLHVHRDGQPYRVNYVSPKHLWNGLIETVDPTSVRGALTEMRRYLSFWNSSLFASTNKEALDELRSQLATFGYELEMGTDIEPDCTELNDEML